LVQIFGQNGGGLCAYDQSPYLDNLAFTNNHATSKGGGLYVDGGGICDIWNCRFINNSVEGHGGGAYFDSYVQMLRYLTFINNSVALGEGLVFKSWNGDFLSNSEFYDSHASYGGGALLKQEKTGLFMNLMIINNYYNVYRDAILRTSDIINNTAYIDVGVYTRGGEIYDDTHFSGNTADFLDSMLFWMM